METEPESPPLPSSKKQRLCGGGNRPSSSDLVHLPCRHFCFSVQVSPEMKICWRWKLAGDVDSWEMKSRASGVVSGANGGVRGEAGGETSGGAGG